MKKEPIRTWAAIMFSDIVGYTALMGENEELAFQLMKQNTRLHQEIVKTHQGKLIKEMGDGVLSSFTNSQDAVSAAFALQKHYLKSKLLRLRIGIHFGEIIVDKHDVFGDAVNLASRLQTLGTPGSILFSDKIYEDISGNEVFKSVSLGKFKLKNVKNPIVIHALANEGLQIPKRAELLKLLESRLKKFMIGGLVLLSVLLMGFWFYHNSFVKSLYAEEDKSIAVLPFQNINNVPDEDYFIDGLTEDIITQLSKISSLKVISKSSVDSYKVRNEPLLSIAKSLGVNVILEGSVQRYKNRIRIRVQLVDVINDKNIWAESFDRELVDLFHLQSEIAQSIAESMSVKMTSIEIDQLDKKPTESVSAYDIYLKGRNFYYKYDSLSNLKAIIEFKRAIQVDPDFALAWAALGDAFSQKFGRFQSERFWIDSSLFAGNKAVALDSNLSDGYKALANAYMYNGQLDKGVELLQKAIHFDPNNPQAVGNLATGYFYQGKLDLSLQLQKNAAGLNPRNYIPFQIVGWTYRLLGEFENAILWFKKSLDLMPNRDTYEQLGLTYIALNQLDSAQGLIPKLLQSVDTTRSIEVATINLKKGEAAKIFESAGILAFFCKDFENAKLYFEKSEDLNPHIGTDVLAFSPVYLGYLYYRNGDFIDAEVKLEGAAYLNKGEIKKNSQDAHFPFYLAAISAIRGDSQNCIYYLGLAKEKKWVDTIMATHNPIFEKLLNNKEFQSIINEINRDIVMMRVSSTKIH